MIDVMLVLSIAFAGFSIMLVLMKACQVISKGWLTILPIVSVLLILSYFCVWLAHEMSAAV
jgi:hypothetical protein